MISETSKKIYNRCFERLMKAREGKIIDKKTTIEEIKENLNNNFKIKSTTKNNYLKSIIYKHKINFIEISKELIEDINKLMIIYNEEYIQRTKKGELSETQKNNYLEWPEIITIYKNKIVLDKDIKNIIICALYVLQPPRRIKDYTLMKLIRKNKKILDKNFNYLVMTKYPYFIFNNYKTAKTYGQQIIFIESQELLKNLNDYISAYHIKNNNILFPYGEEDYKKTLKDMFFKSSLKNISVSILRHSYITYATKNNLLDLLDNREKLSIKMAHSIKTQLTYFINEK